MMARATFGRAAAPTAATHESFLLLRRFRWLKLTCLLLVLCAVPYVAWVPPGGHNGGTWLGYTLGTIGALLIVWLMLFGVRKRRYLNSIGTLRGWLSAHVYLGTTLILVVLLHTGFQFGWNVHTFAFVLMLIVILSGFFGVYVYLRYPNLMTRNRESATREAMMAEVAEIDQNALALADGIAPKIHGVVLRSIQNTRLGGGVWTQLRARDGSDLALESLRKAIAAREQQQEMKTAEMPTMFAMVDFLAAR